MAEHLTREGLEELKKEIEYLETVERKKIAEKIARAASQGDITDSADYSEAKEAQAFLEGRIKKIRKTIARAVIIDKQRGNDKVRVGSTILVEYNGKKQRFEITGSAEANPLKDKISEKSPLVSAFLNHKKGNTVKVETSRGEVKYKIVDIL